MLKIWSVTTLSIALLATAAIQLSAEHTYALPISESLQKLTSGTPSTVPDVGRIESITEQIVGSPIKENVQAGEPVSVSIPSIGLNAPVWGVGVNNKGEMDVPSGESGAVGWYKYGTRPGRVGSAVLAGHVFAVFKNLKAVKIGDEIYLETSSGVTQQFIVREATVYALNQLSPATLFNRNDGRWLNLITCAGTYVESLGTYTHRLIVFAELIENERSER